ncbi:MAG: hypothetical protein ABJF11_03325 [Reichenbachiella sp.]|uniref:hypothetical protein n=1 Tax=Reichenbachiella sp. TaxID=2184521 RepID=UPI0032630C5D
MMNKKLLYLIFCLSLSGVSHAQTQGSVKPSYEYLYYKMQTQAMRLEILSTEVYENANNNKYLIELSGGMLLHSETAISIAGITKRINSMINVPDSMVLVGNLVWLVSLDENRSFEKLELVKNKNLSKNFEDEVSQILITYFTKAELPFASEIDGFFLLPLKIVGQKFLQPSKIKK